MQSWDNLRFFLSVARTGSVTAASEKLEVNQSTVSRRIQHFEEELDVRLFERLTTGYALTPEGEELFHRAARIEEETLAIERHVMGKNVKLEGPIRVTLSLAMSRYLLTPVFKKFHRLHPGIQLYLDCSNSLHNLTAREADVAIRVTPDAIPVNLIGRELGLMKFAVYGEQRYVESWRKSKGKNPLRWIGEDNSMARPAWLPAHVEPLQLVMRTNELLATVDLLNQGLGVGRLPAVIGDAEKKLVRLKFKNHLPEVPVWLLTHVDMRRVSRVSVFTAFVVDELRKALNY